MVTASNGRVKAAGLPELPSAAPDAQSAQRARSLPHTPADVTHGDIARARVLFAGVSLLHAQAPSLATLWAHHAACASHYRSWWLRIPRYGWAVMHTALAGVLRAAEWVTDSPPKLLVAAAVASACWFWS